MVSPQARHQETQEVWLQCGFQVPVRNPRKKVMTVATLQPIAKAKNDVWSWDFIFDATSRGELFRCLIVKDEATQWSLAIEVDRSLSLQRVIAVFKRLVVVSSSLLYVRSDNGPELMAQPMVTFFRDQ